MTDDRERKPVKGPSPRQGTPSPEEERYRAVIETSADGFMTVDGRGRILEVNDAYVRRSGYSRPELLSMHLTQLEARENPAETAAHIERIIREGSELFETLHRARDGTVWQVEVNTSYWPIDGGRFFSFLRDITRRKRSESLLRTRLELSDIADRGTVDDLLRHALDTAELHTGSCIGFFHFVDKDQETLTLQTWSTNTLKTMCSAAGKGRHYPISQAGVWVECVPAGKPVIHNDYASLAHRKGLPEGHAPVTREVVAPVVRDGKIVAIAGVGNKTSDYGQEDAETLGEIASLAMEFVFRKRAEEALRESEASYRTLFDSSTDAIFLLDLEGNFVDANRTAYERLGYTREEFLALSIRQLDDPAFASRVPERLRQIQERGVAVFESGHLRKDGTTMPVEVNSRLFEYKGRPVYFSVIRDISERKRAEELLRRSEEKYRTLFDHSVEGIYLHDLEGRILDVNQRACEQSGYSREELVRRTVFDNLPGGTDKGMPSKDEILRLWDSWQPGEVHTIKAEHLRKDGSVYPVEIHTGSVRYGESRFILATVQDISERKLLEEERLKTQKLESIGTLAGGIAHDFNNLLQGVFGYISLAKMPLDRGDRTYAMLEQAEKALHLSVNLTNQLLTFSKGGRPVKKRVALGQVIADAARFALSGSRAACRLDIDPGLWEVDADEGQIAQVIQNVALNADQAMPLGGTVTVTARNLAAAEAVGRPGLGPRDHVEIAVRDEGVGIPAQYLDKIFDPYFTTKEKGSGLGLATSYSIVKNHEGRMEVESAPGAGSTFTIYLPAVRAAAAAAASLEPRARTRTGRVLVMDDEELVRTIAGQLLASLGHEVDLAGSGESALEKFRAAREAGRPFDIVILDLTMRGGMGGAETVRKLHQIDAGVKAVVSSGYSDDAVTSSYREHGFCAFLKKPYRLEDLKATLDAFLT